MHAHLNYDYVTECYIIIPTFFFISVINMISKRKASNVVLLNKLFKLAVSKIPKVLMRGRTLPRPRTR